MPKRAPKAAGNVFYEARMDAAACNDKLNSREGAAEELGVDRTRLARIERDLLIPYPEEVVMMEEVYNAPQLGPFFCGSLCPLGIGRMPATGLIDLDRLAINVLSALCGAEKIQQTFLDVVSDGKITPEEIPKVMDIRDYLKSVAERATEMRIWIEKNLKGAVP